MKRTIDQQAELCQEFYDTLITPLRYIARRCGYALAVHGSLKRDIDLIAIPWRDSAPDAEYLIDQIQVAVDAIIGTAIIREGCPEQRPCGRQAWSIFLTPDSQGPYIDLSIMPVSGDQGSPMRARVEAEVAAGIAARVEIEAVRAGRDRLAQDNAALRALVQELWSESSIQVRTNLRTKIGVEAALAGWEV